MNIAEEEFELLADLVSGPASGADRWTSIAASPQKGIISPLDSPALISATGGICRAGAIDNPDSEQRTMFVGIAYAPHGDIANVRPGMRARKLEA
jgi:hypothetical protein